MTIILGLQIFVGALIVFFLVIIWSLCRMASIADEQIEKMTINDNLIEEIHVHETLSRNE